MGKEKYGLKNVTLGGLLITLGIVYGDIGTSPLYVMNSVMRNATEYNKLLIYGILSCVFWTLTIQTTMKYVIFTLRADNHGEGGIFALYALIRKKKNWISLITMIGGSALIVDAVITPAITITSSIEGLRLYQPDIPIIPVVISLLAVLFFLQQFGSGLVGKIFGPVMLVWFIILFMLGFNQLTINPGVLAAVNPVYAFRFLVEYPEAVVLLSAVFLVTTGAEALYPVLGHVGINNIRISWIMVKIALLVNYFGQGAYLINNPANMTSINPFYGIMPQWFLVPGIFIAIAAAIIASQAVISGSFTLINEAVSLNFWPKVRILYPTAVKGQVYVPTINWLLCTLCIVVVIYFGASSAMEVAYGLSILLSMIMTTILLFYHFRFTRLNPYLVGSLFVLFILVEGSFLYSFLRKFQSGGWITAAFVFGLFLVMVGWFFGRKIKNQYISFVNIRKNPDIFIELSKDNTIPKIATNLVYITHANRIDQVESKIMYSIFNKHPKRADTYWFLHIDNLDTPDTFEYIVHHLIPGVLIRVDFRLGFKIERKINLYFREVVEDLVKSGEISMVSRYDSLRKHSIPADFLFVNLERIMIQDYRLPPLKSFIMTLHKMIRFFSLNDVKSLELDTSVVIEEKVPIIIDQSIQKRVERVSG